MPYIMKTSSKKILARQSLTCKGVKKTGKPEMETDVMTSRRPLGMIPFQIRKKKQGWQTRPNQSMELNQTQNCADSKFKKKFEKILNK